MIRGASYTLVFDGNCRICQRAVASIRRLDRGGVIEIVASQEPGVRARFSSIPSAAFDEAMHLIAKDSGATWSGAAAVEELLRVLPRTRWFAPLFHVPFVRVVADAMYRWVARNRHRLGCGEHCSL
jgi:predicted DCC family thiol-disulfide oxidoreductase YuxK